jgi:cysteine desulfurase
VNRPTYLDYNATAPVKGEVVAAMRAALERTGNPSSVHSFGREARRALERAREAVAAMVGAAPGQVVFTSGGTEANNQALGCARGSVVVSTVEHDSVLAAAPDAERAAVDPEGRIDLARLERQLASTRPALVSVMLANNETGVIQPVREVVEVARRHGARVHCDAVQAGGKLAIDLAALGADFLTLSAHKLGGPQGVGALMLGAGIEPAALLRGGGQERRWRPGTENVAGIVGFGMAAALARAELQEDAARVGALRDRLEARLLATPGARRNGGEPRVPNTANISFDGVDAEALLIAIDLEGVAASTGAACAAGGIEPSHVLKAMGFSPERVQSSLRLSLGRATTQAEVDRAAEVIAAAVARQRA